MRKFLVKPSTRTKFGVWGLGVLELLYLFGSKLDINLVR